LSKDTEVVNEKGSRVRPIRMPITVDNELQRVAEDQGTTISDVIRKIVMNRIDMQELVAEIIAMREEIDAHGAMLVAMKEENAVGLMQIKQRITRARLIAQEMARMQLPQAKFDMAMANVEAAINSTQEVKKPS
jgi:hypothetical protein